MFRAADLRKRNSTLRDEIAVPDGCALYHMRILEKTGWLDERLFEGLEAFDLSLRAALYNRRTIRVADAAVRPFRAEKDLSAVRLQITAGNGKYIFYKNLPAGISLSLPVLFAAKAARAAAFRQGGTPEAGRLASERGRILCRLERAKRAALAEGVSVWPESLPDAAFLAMDDRNSRIYPLYLAEKEPFLFRRVPQYLRIRRQLARETAQLYRLLTRT
ncbi:MAG: hypothetical protein Q4D81_13795 [Eubacteriales bacterium]|nr:hypothetical protein [Eubacteriales bacterium]